MTDHQSKVAVLGAGVIGQVYAGRLADSGHQVWLLARGDTFTALSTSGVRLRSGGVISTPKVTVVDTPEQIPRVDVAYLAVRADQVDAALPILAKIQAPVIVTLVNLADRAAAVATSIGADRVVLGFPGVGGISDPDGVTYQEVAHQATTIGKADGRENSVVKDLRAAGLRVNLVPDMRAWLATHAVFIAGVGAAIIESGGSDQLGHDRGRSTRMVLSVRDGFQALTRQGITVTPTPLRLIFTVVPKLFAVPYWQKQMRGDLGRLTLAQHVIATRDSEFRPLAAAARWLTQDTPRLDAALTAAGFPPEPKEPFAELITRYPSPPTRLTTAPVGQRSPAPPPALPMEGPRSLRSYRVLRSCLNAAVGRGRPDVPRRDVPGWNCSFSLEGR